MLVNNHVGRYWSRYYTEQQYCSLLEPLLYLTTWLVPPGAVIILNNYVGRRWSRYYTVTVTETVLLVATGAIIIPNINVGRARGHDVS